MSTTCTEAVSFKSCPGKKARVFSSFFILLYTLYMNEKELIEKTVSFVQQALADAEGGHDWHCAHV